MSESRAAQPRRSSCAAPGVPTKDAAGPVLLPAPDAHSDRSAANITRPDAHSDRSAMHTSTPDAHSDRSAMHTSAPDAHSDRSARSVIPSTTTADRSTTSAAETDSAPQEPPHHAPTHNPNSDKYAGFQHQQPAKQVYRPAILRILDIQTY
jgi:hypothetical protein